MTISPYPNTPRIHRYHLPSLRSPEQFDEWAASNGRHEWILEAIEHTNSVIKNHSEDARVRYQNTLWHNPEHIEREDALLQIRNGFKEQARLVCIRSNEYMHYGERAKLTVPDYIGFTYKDYMDLQDSTRTLLQPASVQKERFTVTKEAVQEVLAKWSGLKTLTQYLGEELIPLLVFRTAWLPMSIVNLVHKTIKAHENLGPYLQALEIKHYCNAELRRLEKEDRTM